MADWKLGRRHDACHTCDKTFADEEPHFSLLRVDEGGLVRDDVCGACFKAAGAGGGENDLVWWRTRRRAKQTKGPQLDMESIENLFIALEGREELKLRELRYLLCLVLMRKRRVKVVRVLRLADGEAFSVKRPRREEELTVYVFELTPERQAELKAELVHLFDDPSLASVEDDDDTRDAADGDERGEDGRDEAGDEAPDPSAESAETPS